MADDARRSKTAQDRAYQQWLKDDEARRAAIKERTDKLLAEFGKRFEDEVRPLLAVGMFGGEESVVKLASQNMADALAKKNARPEQLDNYDYSQLREKAIGEAYKTAEAEQKAKIEKEKAQLFEPKTPDREPEGDPKKPITVARNELKNEQAAVDATTQEPESEEDSPDSEEQDREKLSPSNNQTSKKDKNEDKDNDKDKDQNEEEKISSGGEGAPDTRKKPTAGGGGVDDKEKPDAKPEGEERLSFPTRRPGHRRRGR